MFGRELSRCWLLAAGLSGRSPRCRAGRPQPRKNASTAFCVRLRRLPPQPARLGSSAMNAGALADVFCACITPPAGKAPPRIAAYLVSLGPDPRRIAARPTRSAPDRRQPQEPEQVQPDPAATSLQRPTAPKPPRRCHQRRLPRLPASLAQRATARRKPRPPTRNSGGQRGARSRLISFRSSLPASSSVPPHGPDALRPLRARRMPLPRRGHLFRFCSALRGGRVTSSPRCDALGFLGAAGHGDGDIHLDFRMQRDRDLVHADAP